ncbi:MAG: HlyD family efflux transporter periplasmic adaptor subunit [Actinomycetes bacterium]|jgi:HlyD family secretion protein|nr:HlyD family efflux transporter periplasmic adaptor subunit [Actinomycetes bacterium]
MAAKKFKKSYVLIPLAVIVVAAVVVILIVRPFGGGGAVGTQYLTEAITRGDLEKSISSSGQLEAGQTRSVNPVPSGEVDDVQVKVGDTVKRGELLFRVEDEDANTAVTEASRSLSAAKKQLTAAEQGLKAAKKMHVTTAKEILEQQQSSSLSGSLGSDTGDSGSVGTAAQLSTPSAAEKKAAKDQEAVNRAGKKQQVANAEAQVVSAQLQVSRAKSTYADAVETRDERDVTAPVSGTIVAVNVKDGDSWGSGASSTTSSDSSSSEAASAMDALTSSSSSSGSSAAVEIADFNNTMLLAVGVTETEVDLVNVDMKARLVFDAFDDLQVEGTVVEVAPLGTLSGGLVTYQVKIELTEPDARLKPGMNVTATIVLDSATDVLMVPNTAIGGDADSGWTVQVAPDGDTTSLRTVTVEVGLANDSYTAVTGGELAEGDVVVTGEVSADSATSSSMSLGGGMMGGSGMPRTFSGDPNGPGASGSGRGSSGASGSGTRP